MTQYKRLRHLETMEQSGGAGGVHTVLSLTHTDSTAAAVVRGDLVTGQGLAPTWTRLPIGGITGSVVTRDATDVLWSTYGLVGTAAATYTFPAVTGGVALGAGTLTATTTNDAAIAAHTHAITDTADGDTTPATILSTDANGTLRVRRLGVGVAAIATNGTINMIGKLYVNSTQTLYNPAAISASYAASLFLGNGGSSLLHIGILDGFGDTGLGMYALNAITQGAFNTGGGANALQYLTTGNNNSGFGAGSLNHITTTDNNCGLGYFSGLFISGGVVHNTISSESIYIGASTMPLADGDTNEIVIGYNVTGNGSNTTTIGATAITNAYIYGNHIIEEDHFVGITSGTRVVFDDSNGFIELTLGDAAGADEVQVVDSGAGVVATIDSDGNGYFAGTLGVGPSAPAGKATIDQSSAAGAIPVLELDQADLSEEYVNFITATTGAGDPVDTATAVGAAYARLRVAVNGTFKYLQLYDA